MQPENKQGSPAATSLKGCWGVVIATETFALAAEILVLLLTYYGVFVVRAKYFLVGVAALDLLLVSPLQTGRYLVYETIIADRSVASFPLLFRYYRHGYSKSILWRVSLWVRTSIGVTIISIPPVILVVIRNHLLQKGVLKPTDLVSVGFICGIYFLFACGIVILLMWLPRYSLAAHLLPYTSGVREAFKLSRQLMRSNLVTLFGIHFRYGVRFLFAPLIVPWFYLTPHFRLAIASFSRRKIGKFPEKKCTEVLHTKGNHGRIKKIS